MENAVPHITYEIINKIQKPDFDLTTPFYVQLPKCKKMHYEYALAETNTMIRLLIEGCHVMPDPYHSLLGDIRDDIVTAQTSYEQDLSLSDAILARLKKTRLIIKQHLDDVERMESEMEFR